MNLKRVLIGVGIMLIALDQLFKILFPNLKNYGILFGFFQNSGFIRISAILLSILLIIILGYFFYKNGHIIRQNGKIVDVIGGDFDKVKDILNKLLQN